MEDSDGYDEAYRETADLFGSEPEPTLVRHWERLDRALPVLDIGCGQGRNALFLARRGLTVHALDPSRVAVAGVARIAAAEGLSVETIHGGFDDLAGSSTVYSGVLLFGLLPILSWAQIDRLIRLMESWTAPGALLWVTGFTTQDPAFLNPRADWMPAGRNHFLGPNGTVRTFLEPGELETLLEDWDVVHMWCGEGPLHRHGDGPEHHHGLVEGVFRRR